MGGPGLLATVAAALRDHPGEAGVARALEILARAGIVASVSGGRVQLPASLDPELRVALDAIFSLAAARLGEDELVATGRLTALGSLADSIVHELNNHLFAILALVEFLLRDAEPGTKAHHRLELIQSTGLGMKDLARALLDFARERPGPLEPVALDETVESVCELFRLTAAAKAIEIEQRIEPVPMHVLGRRNELRQLLLALLLNAKQALQNSGTIVVELRRDGPDVLLRVADGGPGVPAELGERAFEPFVTTRDDALGLGLAVARAIARRHGGELALERAEAGAAFVARLPLVPGGGA
jgi:C4-dicarboxylate-specific signal transduction histidine kinase